MSPQRLSRRDFLAGSAVVGTATVVGGLTGAAAGFRARRARRAPRGRSTRCRATSRSTAPHQAGIVTPGRPQPAALFVAMDAVVTSKPELVTALTDLTAREPPAHLGLGARCRRPALPAAGERHHRRDRRPVGPDHHGRVRRFRCSTRGSGSPRRSRSSSRGCPTFRNDRLDRSRSHGDLLLQICATDETSCIHALRYLMLGTRGSLVVRWIIHGFQQRPGALDGATRRRPSGRTCRRPPEPARLQGRDGQPVAVGRRR